MSFILIINPYHELNSVYIFTLFKDLEPPDKIINSRARGEPSHTFKISNSALLYLSNSGHLAEPKNHKYLGSGNLIRA